MLFRLASAGALLAAASMAASPLTAADFPRMSAQPVAGVWDADGVNAQNHRWHRRNRIDGGDVVAGVLVLGTIAAIASAANSNRDRQYRYPQRYPIPSERYDYRDRARDTQYDSDRGLDRAVDVCAREVERTARVDTVDGVQRAGDGWRVSGRLSTGAPFTCSVGSDGRIDAIDFDGRGVSSDAQWDDDSYEAARAEHERADAPSYPGGPLQGVDPGYGDRNTSPDLND